MIRTQDCLHSTDMTILLANAGLPMLMLGLPAMLLLLLPIVLIEAYWYHRKLHIPWKMAWGGSWDANLWSTLVGIPLTWFALVILEFTLISAGATSGTSFDSYLTGYLYFVFTSAWLIPVHEGMDLVIYGATLVLLLPAYVVSYLMEAGRLNRRWADQPSQVLRRQVWIANSISYGLLFALAACRFLLLAKQ